MRLGALARSAGAGPRSPSAHQDVLPLHECRLEHPLHLTSIAARCGVLAVPEDRDAPAGRDHRLARRRRARAQSAQQRRRRCSCSPAARGRAPCDLYVSSAGAFARINRNHDIVLVDQRGTGKSAPLSCDYPGGLAGAGRADAGAAPGDRWPASRKFGDRVRFYTTSVAVRDLDEVRAALGLSSRSICTAPRTARGWRSSTCGAIRPRSTRSSWTA